MFNVFWYFAGDDMPQIVTGFSTRKEADTFRKTISLAYKVPTFLEEVTK